MMASDGPVPVVEWRVLPERSKNVSVLLCIKASPIAMPPSSEISRRVSSERDDWCQNNT